MDNWLGKPDTDTARMCSYLVRILAATNVGIIAVSVFPYRVNAMNHFFLLNLGLHRLDYIKLHVLEGFTEVFILAANI